jgi:hypothetical protein
MSDERRNPYVTVVGVWIVSSLGLGLMVSFPISFVVLLLVLAVVGYVAYKAYHRDLGYRDLAEKLISDSRLFAVKVFEDFGIVFARVSAWWLRREAQIQKEIAQKRERQDRKRDKLAELKRKRKATQFNGYPTTGEYENIPRRSEEERTEG